MHAYAQRGWGVAPPTVSANGVNQRVDPLLAERRPRGLQALTWELAYLLPLQRDEKLRLLAQDDPSVRCTQLRELLEQLQG